MDNVPYNYIMAVWRLQKYLCIFIELVIKAILYSAKWIITIRQKRMNERGLIMSLYGGSGLKQTPFNQQVVLHGINNTSGDTIA